MVIKFSNVSFRYGDKSILNKVTFSFTDKEKIGLMGLNGVGKSTLLKLIVEKEKTTEGVISKTGNMIINYLEQDPVFDKNKTIFESVMSYGTEKHPISTYEVNAILNKLKLCDYNRSTENLSGGEKKRLSLAIALLRYSDILILDEPTNHLDNDAIVWLERYLIKFKRGLLLVTHDRYFLERVCNNMLELDDGKIYEYKANYSKYLELKAQRMAEVQHNKEKIKSLLRNELNWINRGAQARSTKQKSRVERFNDLSNIKFEDDKKLEISSLNRRLGNKTIEIIDASKTIDGKTLFSHFNFSLSRVDRVGVVGNNGCGKSTLFKVIMGQIPLDEGKIIIGETVKIGYFSQNLDEMEGNDRVIDYIKQQSDNIETIDGVVSAKTMLNNFMFDDEKQYSYIKTLSGGEKRRLQLVKVLMSNPNILILDEPTNDLDIYTLEILEEYLESFLGPIIVVSHDRYFLDKVCDKILVYRNGNIEQYNGQFSELLNDEENSNLKTEKDIVKRESRSMPSKLRNELQKIEECISNIEKEIKEINDKIVADSLNYEEVSALSNKRNDLENELQVKTNRYFELLEIKEQYNN